MKEGLKKYIKGIITQVPILIVLLDLHFDGIEGLDKAESQKHLSRGNQLLNAGQLAEALTHYHAAIDQDERNYQAYYMRATVFLAMGKARSALPDLNQVVKLQPNFVQARLQRGNLFLKMGKFNEAQTDYEAVLAHEDNQEAALKVEEIRPLRRNINHARSLMEANDFHGVIELFNAVIESCPWNPEFRETRSLAFERVGDLRRAISDLKPTTILKLDNTAAYLKMSVLWYRLGEVEQSLEEIRECLKLDPDHSECYTHYKSVKKLFKTMEAAKARMADKNWDEAINKYKKVLSQEARIAPLTIEIKLKICECYVKANMPEEGIIAADEVLTLDTSNIPALLLRSEAQTQSEDYQQAVDDLQKASQIDDKYPGLAEKIKKAQKLLKQSQKRDYYKILGVPRNADKKQIIKSYRQLAREWHPDNFQDEKDKKTAEKKFIEIAAAKEVLSDPEKVKILKDGFDPMDSDDVNEWEKEQALGRTSTLFEFFFHHNSKKENQKDASTSPFEELFRSFTQRKPERFHEQDAFEQQFKNQQQQQQFKHAHEELWKQQQREQQLRDAQLRERQQREMLQKQHDLRQKQRDYRQKQEEIMRKHREAQHKRQEEQRFQQQPNEGSSQHPHSDFEQKKTQYHQQHPTYKEEPSAHNSQYRQHSAQQPFTGTAGDAHRQSGYRQQQHSNYRSQDYQQSAQSGSGTSQRSRQQQHGHEEQSSHKQQHRDPHSSTQQQGHQHRSSQQQHQAPFGNQQQGQQFTNQQQNPRQRQAYGQSQQQQGYDDRQRPQTEYTQFRKPPNQGDQVNSQSGSNRFDDRYYRTSHTDIHQQPTKKKTKSKQQFKKKTRSAEEKETAKRFTKGTDGKWYHKGDDGRWKMHDGPPPDPQTQKKAKTKKAKPVRQTPQQQQQQKNEASAESYQDANGNVYVKGTDGNWYMRVQPPNIGKQSPGSKSHHQSPNEPNNQKSYNQQQGQRYEQTYQSRKDSGQTKDQQHPHGQQQSEPPRDLPRGLFRNERGQISDRIGNIYQRLQNGRYTLAVPAAEAKERLKEKLRSHKQADLLRQQKEKEAQTPPPPPKQNIYHDAAGNVFVKDADGNLIRIKPGHQKSASSSGQQPFPSPSPTSSPGDQFSYRDSSYARGQERWHSPSQQSRENENINKQHQQQTGQSYRQPPRQYEGQQQQGYQQQSRRYSDQTQQGQQPYTGQQNQQRYHGQQSHYHRSAHHSPSHEEL